MTTTVSASWITPRDPRRYDPTQPVHVDDAGLVHVHDHDLISVLLRSLDLVTLDASAFTRGHQTDAFVWGADAHRRADGSPGRHPALRALLDPWFSPAAVAGRLQSTRQRAARLVAGLPREFDAYHDLLPLFLDTTCALVGITPAAGRWLLDKQRDQADMTEWPPPRDPEVDAYMRQLLGAPGLSGFAAAMRDATSSRIGLTEREFGGMIWGVVGASVLTTAAATTLTVGLCVTHGRWPLDVERPGAVGHALEEAIRLGNPFPVCSRWARTGFDCGGVSVERDQQLMLWLSAANRAPQVGGSDLGGFDPDRRPNRHLGWSGGIHICAAIRDARATADAVLVELARQRPDLGIAGEWGRYVGTEDGFTAAPVTSG